MVGIFIPNFIRVDLSTSAGRLAGASNSGAASDDSGFNQLCIFGCDTLVSNIQTGFGAGVVPGRWPNGRRFGDDVMGIGVLAVLSDLRVSPPSLANGSNTYFDVDHVTKNDIGYNKVFPYAATMPILSPQSERDRVAAYVLDALTAGAPMVRVCALEEEASLCPEVKELSDDVAAISLTVKQAVLPVLEGGTGDRGLISRLL